MTTYSRISPSPRYLALQAMYQQLHDEGDVAHGLAPERTFNGQSLIPHVKLISQLITHFDAKTLLDYGAGKGTQYGPLPVRLPDGRSFPDIPSFWGVQVSCYDPGHEPFATPPTGRTFDAVISTDVVEHCPEDDLEWIVGEMFEAATRFVYVNAANYPADKILPNGENAHITQQPLAWWTALFERVASRYPAVPWLLSVEDRFFDDQGKAQAQMHYAGTIRIN